MEVKEFVATSVEELNQIYYEKTKSMLCEKYLEFKILEWKSVSKEAFAEKLCDYYEKIELKTGKSFYKHVESFASNLDSIVGKRIAKDPSPRKNDSTDGSVCRARKYYDRALSMKDNDLSNYNHLYDYVRIMICLYHSIIQNNFNPIRDFDYSLSDINVDGIITSMKKERDDFALNIGKKMKFNDKDLYSADAFTLVTTIIIVNVILSNRVEGEYYHG